jgi:hypothetical protein
VNEDSIFADLNDAFVYGTMVPFVGAYSTGKTRILRQLMQQQLTGVDIDQIITVHLRKPKKLDTNRNASTVTLDLFTQMLYDMRLIHDKPLSQERPLFLDDPKRLPTSYADERFYDLFERTKVGIPKRRGLIIDNAQHLDDITLSRLDELWESLDRHIGIIMCIQMETNDTAAACIQRKLRSHPSLRDSCSHFVEITTPSMTEFGERVIPKFLNALNAEFSAEAVRAVVRFGFEQRALHRIWAPHFKRNPASGRVLQKVGMQYEGCQREHYRHGDGFEDALLYGMLRRDFDVDPPQATR